MFTERITILTVFIHTLMYYVLIDSNLVRLDGAAALGSVLDPENPFSALTQVFSVLGSVFLKVTFLAKISNNIDECLLLQWSNASSFGPSESL